MIALVGKYAVFYPIQIGRLEPKRDNPNGKTAGKKNRCAQNVKRPGNPLFIRIRIGTVLYWYIWAIEKALPNTASVFCLPNG
jgi:hypothetical protein